MSSLENQLLSAIKSQNVSAINALLAAGADPNHTDEYGDSALMEACDSWHDPEKRLMMVRALLDAGADPQYTDKDGGGVLFSCVIAKDANLIEHLLTRGANPNKEHDMGEPLYDWAEFDYRYDEYDLNMPEDPTDEDRKSEEAWLGYLSRLASKYGKNPPDYLIALRRAGALTGREKQITKQAEQGGGGNSLKRVPHL